MELLECTGSSCNLFTASNSSCRALRYSHPRELLQLAVEPANRHGLIEGPVVHLAVLGEQRNLQTNRMAAPEVLMPCIRKVDHQALGHTPLRLALHQVHTMYGSAKVYLPRRSEWMLTR